MTEHLPNADIVYDRFYFVMNLNAAVDEVRRDQWRQSSGEAKSVIKGQRFLFFSNQGNLDID